MATVTFQLKHPEGKEETPILLVVWIDQKKIRLSTGKKIHPKNWNPETHLARQTQEYETHQATNDRLKDIKKKALACYDTHLIKNDNLFLDRLRDELRLVIRPKPQTKAPTFTNAIEEYIKTVNRKQWTIKHYNTTLNTLISYQKYIKKNLDFDSIDMDFYESFIKYCNEKKIFSLNTTGTHIKNIKIFYNYMLEKGFATKELSKKFKVFAEESDSIYLDEKELQIIYDLDLSENLKLDRQRDLFIIGCYTGLRFGDLAKIKKENIIQDGTRLRIRTEKTGEMVEIPLHWMIKKILKKYPDRLPKAISDQKMNDYLKDIAEEAELNDPVIKVQTKGGVRVETKYEKWQLVTVHTARRSFASNMYLAGIPAISIMKITGHRSEKSFLKYIKISPEQNADLIESHPFFHQPETKSKK